MAEQSLLVRIGANIDSFEKGMSKVQKEMNNIQNKFKSVGDKFTSIGKKLTTGVTLPIVAIAAASAKMASDFETSFSKVQTIADTSVKSVGQIRKEVMSFSNDTGVAATDINEALYQCISAGVDTADAMGVLEVANKAAKGGFSDLTTSIDGVTSVLNAYGLESSDAEKVANSMLIAQNKGKTTFDELAKSLYNVTPTAASVNVSIDQVTSSLAAMTSQGTPTAVATTRLRQAFVELDKEGSKAKETFEKIAGKSFKDFISEGGNVAGAMSMMNQYAKDNNVSIKDLFSSVEAGDAALQLITEEGAKVFNEALNEMETNTTALNDAFKKMDDTPAVKMEKAVNRIKNAMIDAGAIILPIIADIAEFIGNLISKFSDLDPKVQNVILVFAGIAAVIGPLLVGIGSLLGIISSAITIFQGLQVAAGLLGVSVGAMCAPFIAGVAIIAGLIAAGVALYLNWDKVKAYAQSLGDKISEVWTNVCDWTSQAWSSICDTIGSWVDSISDTISNWITSISDWFTNCWDSMCDWTSSAWETICNLIQVAVMFIAEIISAAVQIFLLPWTFIWENFGSVITEKWNEFTTLISEKCNEIINNIKAFFEPIVKFFGDIWENVKSTSTQLWSDITSALKEKWDSIKEGATSKFNEVKEVISNKWNEVKSNTTEKWNAIKSDVTSKFNEIKNNASSKFDEMKTNVSNTWDNIKNTATNTWNSIKDAISKPIDKAKDAVKEGIDKIKGFMNFSWELPKLKMPHFNISGKFSLNPPSVPSFGINWYHTGGIFRKPTVLGDGRGVGDAVNGIGGAPEAVLPIDKLPQLLGLDKQNQGGLNLNIENFNNTREQDIKELVEEIAFYLRRKNIAIGG